MSDQDDIAKLKRDVALLRQTLWTLIGWLSGDHTSPLKISETRSLLESLEGVSSDIEGEP